VTVRAPNTQAALLSYRLRASAVAARIVASWNTTAIPWNPLALIAAAWALEYSAHDYWRFAAALIVVAIGWSFATAGAALRLYGRANPSRAMLAAHDAALFLSAIAGAMASAFWLPV